tara:strand:+ start:483 stop:1031 length:549 start_codon:yes stop_codon:yes gene_type:complete
MKIMRVISGSIILFSVLVGGFVGYDDSGTYELDVPSCASDEIQQLGNDSIDFCDKSMMMGESIDIPIKLSLFIDIEVGAEWDEPDTWIGIVTADQAEKCTETDGYLLCDTDELEFYSGGPDSEGTVTWNIDEGEYRFVAGSSVETTGTTTNVEYEYSLQLTNLVIWSMVGFGVILILLGLKD